MTIMVSKGIVAGTKEISHLDLQGIRMAADTGNGKGSFETSKPTAK